MSILFFQTLRSQLNKKRKNTLSNIAIPFRTQFYFKMKNSEDIPIGTSKHDPASEPSGEDCDEEERNLKTNWYKDITPI